MIEPALSAEEWARRERALTVREVDGTVYFLTDAGGYNVEASVSGVADLTATIALVNAALPDSDPRKITRAWVDYLRETANDEDDARSMGEQTQVDTIRIRAIADALASYVQPAP